MLKRVLGFSTWVFCTVVFTAGSSYATGIQWSGQYRAEAIWVDDTTLGETGQSKRYGLHHLTLRPEIVPADRFILKGQLEILNSGQHAYSNRLGEFWGGKAHTPQDSATSPQDAYTLRSTLDASLIDVSQLYLQWFQDFGLFKVGRMPLDFGLGMSYSAGNGLWDHWMTTRDAISYTIQMGNFRFTPTYAKLSEGRVQTEDDVNEYLAEISYENVDTGLIAGAHYRMRRAGRYGNDTPAPAGFNTALDVSGFEEDQTSFYFQRKRDTWNFALELSFLEGTFGITDSVGRAVQINSFGVATELNYSQPGSRWAWHLKTGLASGDDPESSDVYEGFVFNRNYDVSLLMFNHVLGARNLNILRTAPFGRAAQPAGDANSLQADVESISNVLYVSPQARYRWSDSFFLEGRFTTGFLQDVASGASSDLGYEVDILADYKVGDRFTWRNGFAFLLPGDSFTGINNQYPNSFAFGWISQAAIQF